MTFDLQVAGSDSSPDVTWLHEIREGDVVVYRMGRQGISLIAEWPGVARLTCNDDGTSAIVSPAPGASTAAVANLRGVMAALLGDQRGGLGVHASSVAVASEGILFLGESGQGKSTAAAELCLHHGARLLADDAALLEYRDDSILVVPSEDTHHLTQDAMRALGVTGDGSGPGDTDKTVMPARATASEGVPLALVVSLRFDDGLKEAVCTPLGGADAAARVIGSMFRLDVIDRRQELDRVMRVYQRTTFVEIARPRAKPSAAEHALRALRGTHDE